MHKLTMTGAAAELRWGYHRAADLGTWTIDADRLTATIVNHDAFKLSQRPLAFVVRRSHGQSWTWPVEQVTVQGGSVTARLCPQESV